MQLIIAPGYFRCRAIALCTSLSYNFDSLAVELRPLFRVQLFDIRSSLSYFFEINHRQVRGILSLLKLFH